MQLRELAREKQDALHHIAKLEKDNDAYLSAIAKKDDELTKLQESWSQVNRAVTEKDIELGREKELYI